MHKTAKTGHLIKTLITGNTMSKHISTLWKHPQHDLTKTQVLCDVLKITEAETASYNAILNSSTPFICNQRLFLISIYLFDFVILSTMFPTSMLVEENNFNLEKKQEDTREMDKV